MHFGGDANTYITSHRQTLTVPEASNYAAKESTARALS